MRNEIVKLIYVSLIMCTHHLGAQEGTVGHWTFDDQNDRCKATVGSDLELVGSHTVVAGPESGNDAMNIGIGSFYIAQHNIAANGGGSRVNEFTLVMDIKVPQLGKWYTLYQINPLNTDDGEWFFDTSGRMGVRATGYTDPIIAADKWYRLAIAVKNGARYDYYLNGHLVLAGQPNGIDERFSLGPLVLFFADENQEDNPVSVAEIKMFSRALSDAEIAALGGFDRSEPVKPFLSAGCGFDQELILAVDPAIHEDYGFAYPLTYKISIPAGSSALSAYKRYSYTQEWTPVLEKSAQDFFNGIEAVRFDYGSATAYISAGFGDTDSLFLKIVNSANESIPISYQEICPYYDNRDAAVTASADDWAESGDQYWYQCDEAFQITCRQFRKYHLWLSCGIITQYCTVATWQHIQTQLDSGYVEACSHSRTHSYGPYLDPVSQIAGSKQDLIENLNMPESFKKGGKEYIYTWIAPANYYDETVNTLIGAEKYLINRRYNVSYDRFAEWNYDAGYYHTCGISREASPIWEGTTDLDALNAYFDLVLAKQGIYHVMTHPYFLLQDGFAAAEYAWKHLEHIGNRKNLWYVSLGHLYLYHYAQQNAPRTVTNAKGETKTAANFRLGQNYPNPFNSSTSIHFELDKKSPVRLCIYNMSGRLVDVLMNENKDAGAYTIHWDAGHHASGVYFYQLVAGDLCEIKRGLLIK